jgi:tetratricopeptide (TPR) repeat protein
MLWDKPLKNFLFPAVNVLIALLMAAVLLACAKSVIQTFPVAHMSALRTLKPVPMDYFWKIGMENAPIDKARISYYKDYYKNFLQVYPMLQDVNGILGCCYYYLGNESKAARYFKKAVEMDPLYSWNYYDLAVLDIRQDRYRQAASLLEKMLGLDPSKSIQKMFSYVYYPLLEPGGKQMFKKSVAHLKMSYMMGLELLGLIHQIPDKPEAGRVLKEMDLQIYAF